ncbi:hypothetical protein [Gluconacetobacter tumulicola]|uniref:Uncharacterized protein n=1 Tax=Gluconacetobacter tumulicola TaxID=1017177 RepID=A0A7W4JF02_9PROT|nr:hypothetical protein [Gluconacetobacter tumulicola]MBB2180024.1 hypothetical protein [Gluconacetobacter tumulicola]
MAAPVRFVGCPADGQVGPIAAPARPDPKFVLPASLPAGYAVYEAQDLAAVAPVGWTCTERYGSAGSYLLVAPGLSSSAGLSKDAHVTGPAIQVSATSGDTSGRFAVARVIARMFPEHAAFVRQVVAEGIEPAGNFPAGPYPADIITARGPADIAYTTPPGAEGMGTQSWLRRDGDPIEGVAHLSATNDLMEIQLRLPADRRGDGARVIALTRGLNAGFTD